MSGDPDESERAVSRMSDEETPDAESGGDRAALVVAFSSGWDGGSEGTNAARLAERVRPPAWVFESVSSGSQRRRRGGASGSAGSNALADAYTWLAESGAKEGLPIFIVGGGLGATLARLLVGVIVHVGIAPPDALPAVAALARFRNRPRTPGIHELQGGSRSPETDEDSLVLRESHAAGIRMLGVFDTVGALGVPDGFASRDLRLHDSRLSGAVEYAFQALAVDEHRSGFHAAKWTNEPETTVLEQRWFAGSHGQVVGRPSDGLSLLPLAWMVERARAAGLPLVDGEPVPLDAYRQPIVDSYRSAVRGYARLVQDRFLRPIGDAPGETLDPSVTRRSSDLPAYRPQNPGLDALVTAPEMNPPGAPPSAPVDRVELVGDRATTVDLLGRKHIAEDLARRLRRHHVKGDGGGSFLVHVDGPWGAGKSTLLNFLRMELCEGPRPWLVVDFNAWRERRSRPPWWALLASLRAGIREELGPWGRMRLRMAEARERLRTLGLPFGMATVLVGAAILLLTFAILGGLLPSDMEAAARTATVVLGLVALLWGVARVAGRFVFWDSARSARSFEEDEAQPMRSLARHFTFLVETVAEDRLGGRRGARRDAPDTSSAARATVFLIDDLDRCDVESVVDLLEAIQNLVRDSSERFNGPYFVVAADGRWIRRGYEACFERFNSAVGEPGRPLGYLFLDKLFQMTVQVPSLTTQLQEGYMRHLLGVQPGPEGDVVEIGSAALPMEITTRIRRATGEDELSRLIDEAGEISEAARMAAAAHVIDREGDADQSLLTTHNLLPYAVHLPANPRSMKRFINAYEIERAVGRVEDRSPTLHQRAVWTILRLRWPEFADQLARRPDLIAPGPPEGTGDGPALLREPELARLLAHPPQFGPVDVRVCRGLDDVPSTDVPGRIGPSDPVDYRRLEGPGVDPT